MPIPKCSAIDTGLFLDTTGDIRTCCSGSYNFGNIEHEPLPVIFSKESFTQTKQSLDNRVLPDYCKNCAKIESQVPGASQMNEFFNKFYPSNGTRQLKQIDLRWSNVCNLSCRYCDPRASSQWEIIQSQGIVTVGKKFLFLIGEKPRSANREYHQTVLNEIEKNKNSIENVLLLGGEPLMQKQNELLLEILSPNTTIEVISNMSVPLENNKIYNLLKGNPKVRWHISFDNIGDRFEYVRYGANWDQFCNNLTILKNDFAINQIQFHPVYGLWSATHLNEYINFANEHQVKITWQLGGGNWGHSIFDHSDEIKNLALAEIKSLNTNDTFLLDVANRLALHQRVNNIERSTLDYIEKLEHLMPPKPNKSFADLWPELQKIFETHLRAVVANG